MNKPTNFAEAMNEEMKVRPITKTKYYYVAFGTGSGDFFASTLDEAKQLADDRASYTQRDISIFEFETGETVSQNDNEPCCERKWWGVPFDNEISDDSNPIDFGDFGYYSDWE